MRFKGPDQVVYRYLELSKRLGSARGQNPVAGSGYVFAVKCKRCGFKNREERISRDRQGRTAKAAWICSHCGDPWNVEIGFLMKHEIDGTPKGCIEDLYAELSILSKWISQLGHWERRIYVELYLVDQIGDYRDVALEANKRYPRAKRGWTQDRVRKLVQRGRETLSYRIFKAGMQAIQ